MPRLQLTRLCLAKSPQRGSFVGDPCQRRCCKGVLGVYSVHHRNGKIIRYLSCNDCNWKPEDNKISTNDPDSEPDGDE